MLAIDLQFIAGRFHATPWGNSPNEGVPEWPPSPWRLARALVSTSLGKAQGIVDADTLERLCHIFASPPLMHLPPATVAHARHYLALYGHDPERGNTKSALVFDTFVAVAPTDTLTLYWPDLTIPASDLQSLDLLLARLDYLGRSESWVRGKARSDGPVAVINCMPLSDDRRESNTSIVRVLCPKPSCTLEELQVETSDLQRERRPLPSGAVERAYLRDQACFVIQPSLATARPGPAPQVVAFLLDGPVLPTVKDTLLVADLFRKTAIQKHATVSLQLSGKDEQGVPVKGHHHMYVLPSDEDGDGLLDHIFVYLRDGAQPDTLSALAAVRHLYRRDQDLAVVYLGNGAPQDIDIPTFGSSTVWESATPFLPIRHTKLRGTADARRAVDTELDQLLTELGHQGLPAPVGAEVLEAALVHGRRTPWYDFRAVRRDRAPVGHACGFRITFAEPVAGPILVGGEAHYGMGRFVPVKGRK
jgi:CRISPR-associated protein Csb2